MADLRSESPPDVTHDGDGLYRTTNNHRNDYMPTPVVLVVAPTSERDVTEAIDTFSKYVDSAALDRLFTSGLKGPSRTTGSYVGVNNDGVVVTIYSGGKVIIAEEHQ